jgi:hypothetical protein
MGRGAVKPAASIPRWMPALSENWAKPAFGPVDRELELEMC